MKKIVSTLLLTVTAALTAPLSADVLLLDAISAEAPNAPAGILRPERGLSMTTVRQRFGEPLKEHATIGEPPITRWDYEMFSVFFEHEFVLNSVVHRN